MDVSAIQGLIEQLQTVLAGSQQLDQQKKRIWQAEAAAEKAKAVVEDLERQLAEAKRALQGALDQVATEQSAYEELVALTASSETAALSGMMEYLQQRGALAQPRAQVSAPPAMSAGTDTVQNEAEAPQVMQEEEGSQPAPEAATPPGPAPEAVAPDGPSVDVEELDKPSRPRRVISFLDRLMNRGEANLAKQTVKNQPQSENEGLTPMPKAVGTEEMIFFIR